jgi:hypothetical protein
MARIYCPNCGSEVVLPETSEVGIGITISKETNGDYALPLETIKNDNLNSSKLNNDKEIKTMRDERMNVLVNAGVDTSKYFNVTLPNGDIVKMTMGDNGVPVVVTETNVTDDPILNQIIEDGYVRNTKLHRRFTMAQMFKMLNYVSYWGTDEGYDACLRNRYGYNYQFTMMLEEVRVLSKLEDRDIESFNERSHFFTKDVVVATCEDYLEKLKAYVETLKEHKCKGVPYKKVKGQNIFVDDLDKKIYMPILRRINRIKSAKNYKDMYRELRNFNCNMLNLDWKTRKCKAWIDAYKGNGAYYTLKNMVMYHNCNIYDVQYREAHRYNAGTEAVKFIQSKLDEYAGEGWRYMAMLKKCIADNHFDFSARMSEIYNKQ